MVIAEIQQSSNVTYRLYDYGRLGADGKPRPLHVERSLAVLKPGPVEQDWDFGGHGDSLKTLRWIFCRTKPRAAAMGRALPGCW